ncbi:MAG: hypothetical protein H6546_05410 [Chitinophagales bacterium]|nr:hypothetical protein [Chitinophagales bacterium]
MKVLYVILAAASLTACSSNQDPVKQAQQAIRQANDDDEENEQEIDPMTLPGVILSDVASRFSGAEIQEADQITHEDGSVTYDVEFMLGGEEMEVMYQADGTYLGPEADDEDEGEDDE